MTPITSHPLTDTLAHNTQTILLCTWRRVADFIKVYTLATQITKFIIVSAVKLKTIISEIQRN